MGDVRNGRLLCHNGGSVLAIKTGRMFCVGGSLVGGEKDSIRVVTDVEIVGDSLVTRQSVKDPGGSELFLCRLGVCPCPP